MRRETFGELVTRHRKIKQLTQKELARLTETTHTWVGDVERNSRDMKLETAIKFIRALDIPINDLLAIKFKETDL